MTDVRVTDRTGHSVAFHAEEGVPVLRAGLAAGFGLPYECATGTCGSCRATVVGGSPVRLWPGAPGARVCRSPDDILMCQTAAAGPLELSIRGAFARPPSPACRALSGRLSLLRRLTSDVAEFQVALPKPLDYAAGQFVLVTFDGLPGARAYSMTRFQPERPELDFLIRRCAGGGASRLVFEGDPSGIGVGLFGPLGKATFTPAERRPLIMIAGGSGVAGLLSIIARAADSRHFSAFPSALYFGLRSPADAYLLDELNRAARVDGGGLSVIVAFSEGEAAGSLKTAYPAIRFETGLIHEVARRDLDMADARAREGAADPLYFVAGPAAMVDAAMRMLAIERKIKPTDIRYDRFN